MQALALRPNPSCCPPPPFCKAWWIDFWQPGVILAACGLSLVAACKLLRAEASVVAERGSQVREHQQLGPGPLEHWVSSCSPQARLICGTWALPDQALSACPLHWQADSSPLSPPGKPPCGLCTFNKTQPYTLIHTILTAASALQPQRSCNSDHVACKI